MKTKFLVCALFSFSMIGCQNSKEDVDDTYDLIPKPIVDNPYWNYTEQDFPTYYEKWGNEGVKRINQIERLAVEKVANTPSKCDEISMVALAENKSTPKEEIVVFVDCTNGERFYVSEKQLTDMTKLKAQSEKAVSQEDAFKRCKELIISDAKYPSSVDFKLLDQSGFTAKTTGGTVVKVGFYANNSYGNKISAVAKCLFTTDGEIEISITSN